MSDAGASPDPDLDAMAARPRVVVVDDDASIRRFVAMALEDLPVEPVSCADAAAARAALQAGPAVLVLADLMMPGESGLDLLAALAADPVLRGPARLAVFSAGVDAEARQALQSCGVWRELSKPVGLQALQDCVLDALAAAAAVPPADARSAAAPLARPASPGAALRDADSQAAIERLFGGDVALYDLFRAQAMAHFPADLAALETARAAADAPAIRRQAHSLKSVLATLGDAQGSAIASQLEQAAHAGDLRGCGAVWPALRLHLQQRMVEESDSSRIDPSDR
jgi:CheY-like chemotaxis protein/HPt (histidine-containing phosphotransfer) domain-containing protein